ncbi:unnamed protein product [Rotaria magnacalcarata]|uniref:DDB1-and CUL4-associated factor 5 n=1 Tax=Rotaria magnacalcarata TaxID=392030 RepID=A0A819CS32_9BILA|nr:unnamed protein product [Rotaria magnacalcarata]CAF2044794.1 unnamed protein product [Rotaria magnacalcarata]CAF3825623.1 unnamed protein product [Rotaria magnacalcarata]CAF3833854.1 unnamed protein product [Rotaria magnacalcarata]
MMRRYKSFNLIHQLRDETFKCNRGNFNRSKYLQHRFDLYTTLNCQDGNGHSGCVNALDFSSDGIFLASGGDDKRVVLWNMTDTLFDASYRPPTTLTATHLSNIFSIKFDNQNRRIISAGNDEQILVHDIEKQHQGLNSGHADELVDVFLESSPVNCLSVQPQQNDVFIAATEDGHVHLYDLRSALSAAEHDQPSTVVAESFDGSFHSCIFHPQQTFLVATANARQGIELYDIRLSRSSVLRYGTTTSSIDKTTNSNDDDDIEGMSVTFNSNGSLLYALRRRLPPVLFKLHEPHAFCQFDADNFVNLCTMKAGCFVGDHDQYIASGSDDFNVYIWRVPNDDDTKTLQLHSRSNLSSDHFVWNAHMILHGHRSVVNQVRYSPRIHTLVSSGVEKVIKMWTPYQTRNHNNNNSNELSGRQEMYSHRDYLQALLESGSVHHDSSVERFDEDRRMLAFFDSLLQRELGRGHNDSSDDDSDDLSITIDSSDVSDDIDDSSFRSSQSEDEDDEDMPLEDINSQTVDLTDSTTHFNNATEILSSRSRPPTIVSLAKNYRIHYVQMIKAKMTGNTSCPSEKHALESPTMTTVKRQRSSSNYFNTLQTLRNRIQNEENEQFYFNDERRM